MDADQRIEVLEEEVKLLKNEIKAVLLDIREHYLDYQNPFAHGALPMAPTSAVAGAADVSPGTAPSHGGGPGPRRQTGPAADEDPAPAGSPPGAAEGKRTAPPTPGPVGDTACLPSMQDGSHEDCGLTLGAIAALALWVEEAVALIGREKLEALVDVRCAAGRIPADARIAILMLARPYPQRNAGARISGRQYLTIMAELDEVLGSGAPSSLLLAGRRPDSRREGSPGTARGAGEAGAAPAPGNRR